MPITTTLTSSSIGRAINLDWMSSKFTSWTVTGSSSGTFTYTVEGALDDLQPTATASVAWFALSSATTANSSLNIVTGPLAAIRLNLSAASSAIVTLRVLQGIGQ
ncbi:hypothetical protein [Bradyrhizobium symbiodeficiens]|uniref:hypothetical protein n=1 Tax=Bradyrhizobium symbiodeficiens TaxID=1404367 RepID=UPI0011E4D109|nr:hypothetical protein [Bradyrhizobium symbiodeficiens]